MNNYKNGRIILYLIGKRFGYFYATISNFPTLFTTKNIQEFKNFAYFLVKYVEGTWAKEISHSIDVSPKKFSMKMKNYIICRKNSLGYLFSTGGIGGIWVWAVQDKTVEAVQPKCWKGNKFIGQK